jgi:uncharacterized membrane protein
MRTLAIRLAFAALAAALATMALAGGPVETFDYANRIPYTWTMSTWPNGQVPVYTDLGGLGILDNPTANGLVANAAAQWSSVPTTTYRAAIAGDFSAIGLGDVTDANITSVIGTWNGGGVDVVYDSDGSIMTNFFGVDPTQVLGITSIDFVEANTSQILEAWVVLSGPAVNVNDEFGVGFAGVATHEFGHSLNLAHTQANGAVQASWILDPPQPAGCAAPYSGTAGVTQVETMYPFSDTTPGGTGQYQGTVSHLDDIVAISDLYPAPGYPASKGTIQGTITDSSGNPVTGVNVIARNVAAPFDDVTSYISGQVSKGNAGPDGSFILNGLTPGARYVVYVDALLDGSYSVPALLVLPGPEEYFNGAMESGSATTDDRCSWTTLDSKPGAPVTANVTFNHLLGAPTFIVASNVGIPTDITPDGGIVVGGEDNYGPLFRWDVNAGTFDNIGGINVGAQAISDDGTKIAGTIVDTDGITKAAIYQNGAWTPLPPVAGAVPCNDSPAGPTYTSAFDISGDGSTVVGLSYGTGGCYAGTTRGFKWTAAGGTVALPKGDSFSLSRAGRANAVNYDGSVITGWDESTTGQRRGEKWINGTGSLIKNGTQPVGEGLDVSRDGHYFVGVVNTATSYNDWRYSVAGGVQILGAIPGQDGGVTNAISDDYSVITGYSDNSSTGVRTPTLWTTGLHVSDLNQLFGTQGISTTGVVILGADAMSGDGRTLTGVMYSKYGYVPWVLKMPTVVMCHAQQTTIVGFPQGMNTGLAQGDTLGPCACSAAAPTGIATLLADKPVAGTAHLTWSAVANATGYDLVRGSLSILRSTGGNFTTALGDCLENDLASTSRDDVDIPSSGDGYWYLVRAASCGGHATYDSGALSQVASRDAGIQASPDACP